MAAALVKSLPPPPTACPDADRADMSLPKLLMGDLEHDYAHFCVKASAFEIRIISLFLDSEVGRLGRKAVARDNCKIHLEGDGRKKGFVKKQL